MSTKHVMAAVWLLAVGTPTTWAQEDPDHCAPILEVATCLSGFDEHGGRFIFVVPRSWNGDLVIYSKPSQGFVSGERANRQFIAFRDAVVGEGYAVGYLDQPYRDYKTDAQQTYRLPQRLARLAGEPRSVYLVGESRGGVFSLDLVETYPQRFAGALVQCAPALGFADSTKWRLDVRVLFDYFFTLGRVVDAGIPRILETPLDSTSADYAGRILGLLAEPDGPANVDRIARVMRFPDFPPFIRGGNPSPLEPDLCTTAPAAEASWVVSPILFLMNQDRDFLAEIPVRSPYDNASTVYTDPENPEADAALNAGVERFRGSRPAMNHQAKYYTPTGDLRRPVLLLYNRFDPLGVLGSNQRYGELVASRASGEFLATWSVDRASHCWFTQAERIEAFHALVRWVNGGEKPISGDAPVPGRSCP